jgi:hypothetical protein
MPKRQEQVRQGARRQTVGLIKWDGIDSKPRRGSYHRTPSRTVSGQEDCRLQFRRDSHRDRLDRREQGRCTAPAGPYSGASWREQGYIAARAGACGREQARAGACGRVRARAGACGRVRARAGLIKARAGVNNFLRGERIPEAPRTTDESLKSLPSFQIPFRFSQETLRTESPMPSKTRVNLSPRSGRVDFPCSRTLLAPAQGSFHNSQ